jgi:protein-S-isoprenylcysteine O-methyltransferase Ste14
MVMEFDFYLKLFIFLYFLLFCTVLFGLRIYRVYKLTGQNPIIFGDSSSPHGYVALIFKFILITITLEIFILMLFPLVHSTLLLPPTFPLTPLSPIFKILGLVILTISFIIIFQAQQEMGSSWRMGIETFEKTKLINIGIYQFSRNPIYLGMNGTILGYFLIIPTITNFTLLFLIHFLFQVLIRQEEAHLTKIQGEDFLVYCQKVRRWL